MSYNPPTGPPLNWNNKNAGQGSPYGNEARGYAPQPQPNYNQQNYGGWNNQYGPPGPPGGYYQQGSPAPQGGYTQQQPQPQYYVQQQPKKDNNSNCLMGCLAAMCLCCTLDAIF